MNRQRETIYAQRREVLKGENLKDDIMSMIKSVAEIIVPTYVNEHTKDEEGLMQEVENIYGIEKLDSLDNAKSTANDILKEIQEKATAIYEDKCEQFGDTLRELERVVMLKVVDQKWMEHIDNMDELKRGVGLRAYGQKDPIVVYREEGSNMFDEMIVDIKFDVAKLLMHATKRDEGQSRKETAKITDAKLQEKAAIELVDGKLSPKEGGVNKTIVNEEPKVGRNDPCPCGSGKKYKNCCGK